MIPSLRRFLPALLIYPLAAHGIEVTTATDEDNGSLSRPTSLREAVKYSSAGATITFAPALSGQTIRLDLGEILIAKSLNIVASRVRGPITISGDKTGNGKSSDDTRIFKITTGTVLLDSLILTGGYHATGSARYGGAIHAEGDLPRLTIRNTTLSNNESTTWGGAIYFLGSVNSSISGLTLQNCTLTGNTTGHDGGAIHSTGTLHVEDSTFTGNKAYQGSAIFHAAGRTTVEDSTFSGNHALAYGGAIYNQAPFTLTRCTVSGNTADLGGGVHHVSGSFTVQNSTIAENSARQNGGGISVTGGSLTLLSATVSANTALISGGGIHRGASGFVELEHSIATGNFAPTASNIAGPFSELYSLTSGDPSLAPLGNYGGPTHTMPPLAYNPAINATQRAVPPTDQRGFARVEIPDIGAVEYQGNADLTRFWKLDFDGDGSPYGVEQALGTDPLVSDPANSLNLTAPLLDNSGQAILSFGLSSAAAPGTVWLLKRSSDLSPGSFAEIYRTDDSTDTAAPGVTFLRTASGVTVVDGQSPVGGAFYRFEALLDPP